MAELVKNRPKTPITSAMRATSTQSAWLRVQQAADLLGVSATTVRRWADSGRLNSRRTPSGQRRFLSDDLLAAVAEAGRDGHDGPRRDDAEQRYELLLETSIELASTLDLDEVLQSAARRLTGALHVPDCDIYRLVGDNKLVCLASIYNEVFDSSWVGHEVYLADWLCEQIAIETCRPVAVGSLNDQRLCQAELDDMIPYGQHSFIALPLVARDKVIGLVDLLDHTEREFTHEEIAVAEAGARPEDCLFIDDLEPNVEGAVAAGLRSLLFTGVEYLRRRIASEFDLGR
jgi:excisionase family DNA binding protein